MCSPTSAVESDALDIWLRGCARNLERTGASRTMVSVTREGRVAGYYCLSAGSLVLDEEPVAVGQRQPNSIPIILMGRLAVLMGRLAVDKELARLGLGASLLRHAVLQAIQAAEIIGMRAIIVHALSEDVVPFYERFGFKRFPGSSRAMYLLAGDARVVIDEP